MSRELAKFVQPYYKIKHEFNPVNNSQKENHIDT